MSTLNIAGAYTAYQAAPAQASDIAVLVVQEIYGINREVRRVTQAFAAQGYPAAAPDLFWRHAPPTTFDYAQRDAARALISTLSPAQIVQDIVDAAQALRGASGARQLAIVTLGWGGRFGLQAANAAGAGAVVAYYPGNIEGVEALAAEVTAAQQYHFAERDPRTAPAVRQAVRQHTLDRDDVEVLVYPGVDHGFANRDRAEYDSAAGALADRRAFDFIALHLSAAPALA